MYSFIAHKETAAIKPADAYDWFIYTGPGIKLPYRQNTIAMEKGQKFGVRRSVNQKDIRLVLAPDVNKVFTITMDVAKKLAKSLKKAKP